MTGCNNPVWGKGLCQRHSPRTPLKKTSLPTSQSIRKTTLKVIADSGNIDKRNIFFNRIWKKRLHVCQHCGKPLGNEPLSYMFDHILEKSKYLALEFEEENIWLVCLACHDEKTRGMISDKYREKINFVTTKFNVS